MTKGTYLRLVIKVKDAVQIIEYINGEVPFERVVDM